MNLNSNQDKTVTFEEALSQASSLGIKPGLEVMNKLLELLGDPQDKLPIIHVAGTNGKGSVCAMLEAIYRHAGYKTGLYTSPHLSSYGERFRINGLNATDEKLLKLLNEVIISADKVEGALGRRPTEFEMLTAMGFVYFAQEEVDVLILEVGLGGRFDATNVVLKPEITVITNVTFDHENFLGNNLKSIAFEKAGIIKPNVSLVCAAKNLEVQQVIAENFARVSQTDDQSNLHWIDKECSIELLAENLFEQTLRIKTPTYDYNPIVLPLSGPHQRVNLATALRVVELLKESYPKVYPSIIKEGVSKVYWPCRLEVVKKEPIVIMDGAHNPDGMKYLAQWLNQHKGRFNRIILLMGMLFDKDRQKAAEQLEPLVDKVFITRSPSNRALQWQEMALNFTNLDKNNLTLIEDCNACLDATLKEAGPQDLVLVTGSLYLVGFLRSKFE